MLFDGWASVGRTAFLGLCTYLVVIAALRLVGKQALAKMSAFDLVITIALGSIVATIPLSTDATMTDGVALIATYLGLQGLTRLMVKRSRGARSIIKAQPQLVLWEGRLLADRLSQLQVPEEEVRAAVRRAGKSSLGEVQAVILENDGEWSVVPRSSAQDRSAFVGLDVPAG